MKWIIPSFPRLSTSSSLWVKVMVKLPMNWPDDLGNKIWNQHPWIQRVPGFSHNIPKEQKGTNLLIVKFHECYMCGMAAWWFFQWIIFVVELCFFPAVATYAGGFWGRSVGLGGRCHWLQAESKAPAMRKRWGNWYPVRNKGSFFFRSWLWWYPYGCVWKSWLLKLHG